MTTDPKGRGIDELMNDRRSEYYSRISIRVARGGLKVCFHSSLYEDSGKQLVAAVASPFTIPNIRVRVSSLFWDAGEAGGSILDTTVLIDPRDLTVNMESGGRRKAVFDIPALESQPLDTFDKRYTVALTDSAAAIAPEEAGSLPDPQGRAGSGDEPHRLGQRICRSAWRLLSFA
jgi:hypothetical protein